VDQVVEGSSPFTHPIYVGKSPENRPPPPYLGVVLLCLRKLVRHLCAILIHRITLLGDIVLLRIRYIIAYRIIGKDKTAYLHHLKY
jgi:hypothetical protein